MPMPKNPGLVRESDSIIQVVLIAVDLGLGGNEWIAVNEGALSLNHPKVQLDRQSLALMTAALWNESREHHYSGSRRRRFFRSARRLSRRASSSSMPCWATRAHASRACSSVATRIWTSSVSQPAS